MEILSVRPSRPLEGSEARVRVRFVNGTAGLMAVRPGKPRYGALEDHGAVLALNGLSQSATPPVFHMASDVLLPGQSKEETIAADALGGAVKVEREVLLLENQAAVYASTGRIGAETSFSRLSREELVERAAKARRGKDSELVIRGTGRLQILKSSRAVKTWPRSFSFSAAQRGFSQPPRAARWSKRLRAWVLDFPDATLVVHRKASTPLPVGSYALIREAETAKSALRLHLAQPEKSSLPRSFKTFTGDGMYTRGTFLEVPPERLVDALRAARGEGLSVFRTNYFLEEYYYDLRPASAPPSP